MSRRVLASVLTALVLTAGVLVSYTWPRELRRGHEGSDVKRLQIRIGGWVDSSFRVVPDGKFGANTEKALRKFQRGYGLTVTGRAGAATYRKIYALQDSDCTPIHFSYGEFNYSCGERDFTGGRVSARQARENIRRVMWQLEALRTSSATGRSSSRPASAPCRATAPSAARRTACTPTATPVTSA